MVKITLLITLLAMSLSAQATNVPKVFKVVGANQGVPSQLLMAIAMQESYDPTRKKIWPWTINVKGKGYYFKTKQQAHNAVRDFMSKNIKSIDIGVMQTNWKWQKHRLKTTWRAFDPAYNIKIGAQILKDCYRKKKNWYVCTGEYHSPGKSNAQIKRAENYRVSVYKHLKRIQL